MKSAPVNDMPVSAEEVDRGKRTSGNDTDVQAIKDELRETRAKLRACEELLRRSEQRFDTILDNAPCRVWVKDMEGRYVVANRDFLSVLGRPIEQVLGKTDDQIFSKEIAAQFRANDLRAISTGKPIRLQEKIFNGPQLETNIVVKFPLMDSDRNVSAVGGIAIDITDRIRAKDELQRAHDELETRVQERTAELITRSNQQNSVAQLGQQALAGKDLSLLLKHAVAIVSSTLDIEYCEILELQPGGGSFALRASVGWEKNLVEGAAIDACKESFAGKTLAARGPIVVEDFPSETCFASSPMFSEHGVKSGIGVIIDGKDHPFGVLCAHTSSHRKFSAQDTSFVQAVADLLVQAIVRANAENALFDSEEKFRNLIEGSIQGVWINRGLDQPVIFANQAIADMLGYTGPEDLFTLSTSDIFTPGEHGRIQKYDVARRKGDIENAPSRYEAQFVRKDGAVVWVEVVVNLIDWEGGPAFQGTVVDISERKKAESALRRTRDELNTILDNIPAYIWYKDTNNYMVHVNKFVADSLGVEAKELEGKHTREYYPDHAEKYWLDDQEVIRTKKSKLHIEEPIAVKDGGTRWVETSKIPILDDGNEVTGILVMATDTTERKRVEDQLRYAHKMEAVGQLTAGVAHDFNNLLAVIMSHAELLQAQLGENEHSVNSLIKAASRGSELTKKLLAFSRQQALRPQPIDVHSLISGMSDMLVRSLGGNIEIRVSKPNFPWPVYADPGQLENAILNLAINARDAMPKGGRISINLENFQLDESVQNDGLELRPGAYLRIEVADDGIGMSAKVISRAFDPFYTTKEIGEGSGLGLSMVYGFVRQTGGDVKILSTKGKGTRVRLYLPRSEKVASPVQELRTGNVRTARGETVLVLEDDADVRDGISKLLCKMGYIVRQAEDGKSALADLNFNQEIDLLLCDVMLPGNIDGPQVAEEAQRIRPDLKVIFMTGYVDQCLPRLETLGNGSSLLTKPVKMADLAKRMREVLDEGKQSLLS
jgi:PAS domain S-box-containing protein